GLRVGRDAARIVVGSAGDEAGTEPAGQALVVIVVGSRAGSRSLLLGCGLLGGRHAAIVRPPGAPQPSVRPEVAALRRAAGGGSGESTGRRPSLRRRRK